MKDIESFFTGGDKPGAINIPTDRAIFVGGASMKHEINHVIVVKRVSGKAKWTKVTKNKRDK